MSDAELHKKGWPSCRLVFIIHRMFRIIHTTAVMTAVLALAGCQQMQMQFPKSTPATQPTDSSNQLRQQNRELRDEIEVMKAEQKAAADRVQELQNRDKTLSNELSKLQFTCSQQAKALDALKSLPEERDLYKKQVEDLTQKVEELQAELAKANPGAVRRPVKFSATAPAATSRTAASTAPVR